MVTDGAQALQRVIEELLPAALPHTGRSANHRVERAHGPLKARLPPRRAPKTDPPARVIIGGHAFMPSRRGGHYEPLSTPGNCHLRVAAAFDELAEAI